MGGGGGAVAGGGDGGSAVESMPVCAARDGGRGVVGVGAGLDGRRGDEEARHALAVRVLKAAVAVADAGHLEGDNLLSAAVLDADAVLGQRGGTAAATASGPSAARAAEGQVFLSREGGRAFNGTHVAADGDQGGVADAQVPALVVVVVVVNGALRSANNDHAAVHHDACAVAVDAVVVA